jgi:hypothetical protein
LGFQKKTGFSVGFFFSSLLIVVTGIVDYTVECDGGGGGGENVKWWLRIGYEVCRENMRSGEECRV